MTARDWLALRPWQRHSLVLTVAGCVYGLIGVVYLTTASSPSRERALWLADRIMPIHWWGAVWIAAGVAAVLSARWPAWADTWGYVALTALASGWSAIYVLSAILAHRPQSLSGACVWALVAFIWWAISGLRNPVPPPVSGEADGRTR